MGDRARALISRRLSNQQLTGCSFRDASALVAWLGAVQAQDYPAAKWAIGLRTGLTDSDIEEAFNAGLILRTHVMRPTWHFVTPMDIRWLLALTSPRIKAAMASYYRKVELDAKIFGRSHRVIERALEKTEYLTRSELGAELKRARIQLHGLRLTFLVLQAELDQVICSGPRRGKHFTYALLANRAPHARTLSCEEALGELARRYFFGHGPATVRDFAWWSGLTMRDARRGIDLVRSVLTQEAHGGLTYWGGPTQGKAQSPARRTHLLPNFDEYLVAYRDRQLVIDSFAAQSPARHEHRHDLIVDGRLAGSWSSTERRGGATAVRVAVARRPSRADVREIEASAEQLGTFLDERISVSVTECSTQRASIRGSSS